MKIKKLLLKKKGVTLLEIMIALTIMTIALTSLFRYLAHLQSTTQKSKTQMDTLIQELSIYNMFKVAPNGLSNKDLIIFSGSTRPHENNLLHTVLLKNKENKNVPIGIIYKYVYEHDKDKKNNE